MRRAVVTMFMICMLLTFGVSQGEAASLIKGKQAYKSGDYATALKEWQPLAERGEVEAQFALGLMYKRGNGVGQDHKQANKWFTNAAQKGHSFAQISLASQYEKGQGVLQDYKQAAYWYTKAAMQGDEFAQLSLGIMFAKGEGVTQDFVQAYAWFNIAASQGNKKAIGARDMALGDMSPNQITKAQALSRKLYNKIDAGK